MVYANTTLRPTSAGRVLGLDDGLRIAHGSNVRELEVIPGGKKVRTDKVILKEEYANLTKQG